MKKVLTFLKELKMRKVRLGVLWIKNSGALLDWSRFEQSLPVWLDGEDSYTYTTTFVGGEGSGLFELVYVPHSLAEALEADPRGCRMACDAAGGELSCLLPIWAGYLKLQPTGWWVGSRDRDGGLIMPGEVAQQLKELREIIVEVWGVQD
jgi:hypothetical protein